MKKNMLKYCFLLLILLFCTNAMSQSSCPSQLEIKMCEGEPDAGQTFKFDYSASGSYSWDDDLNCMLYKENAVDGLCHYDKNIFPLGNGAFIFLLFVLGYSGVLYYRRKSVHA